MKKEVRGGWTERERERDVANVVVGKESLGKEEVRM